MPSSVKWEQCDYEQEQGQAGYSRVRPGGQLQRAATEAWRGGDQYALSSTDLRLVKKSLCL